MKFAWIVFHANVTRYPSKWIEDYIGSVDYQTVKPDIFEINYGNGNERLFKDSKFFKKLFPTHAHAHNFILDEVFKAGYSYAFNSNVDDLYAEDRVERQLVACAKGFDIISTDMTYINEKNEVDQNRTNFGFCKMSIGTEFARGHNIICHPSVVYSKNFWTKCPKLNPDLIPKDDFELWKWALFNGFKFHILPDSLVYYRVHQNNISRKK